MRILKLLNELGLAPEELLRRQGFDPGEWKYIGNEKLTVTQLSIEKKLYSYLLNQSHPVGKHKARWFEEVLGFTRRNQEDLAKQIVFDISRATRNGRDKHGQRYNQVISIRGANGNTREVVFFWMVAHDGLPRLVGAKPKR